MENMKETLSEKLKKLRMKSGLTQAELAEKIKVSPSSIGMYEQGRREPNNHTLSKICKELDAEGDYVLDLQNDKIKSKDVIEMLEEFMRYIETEKNIMLCGKPIEEEQKKKITNALRVAVAVAIHDSIQKK